jgi:hypothetical protein
MTSLTIVIPIGPYHTVIASEAIASAQAQTVPCQMVVVADEEGKGAGWARNRGLEQVTTEYVAFLDADDTLDPRFAEICLGIVDHYAESGRTDTRYVYTDWLGAHNARVPAPDPCEVWRNQTYHLVTTVLPTEAVRAIGGFDEILPGVEDADFYVRLRLSGVCGLHVEAPLLSYREGGQRSKTARASGDEARALQYMTQRYGRMSFMGCCGDSTPGPVSPGNEPQDGDVLAQALWGGNRKEVGRATRRLYPATSFPKLLYVNPADVAAAPHLWRRVDQPVQASNGVVLQPQYQPGDDNWQDVAEALFGGGQPQAQPSAPVEYKPKGTARKKADVIAQTQAAAPDKGEWTRVQGDLE